MGEIFWPGDDGKIIKEAETAYPYEHIIRNLADGGLPEVNTPLPGVFTLSKNQSPQIWKIGWKRHEQSP